MQSRKTQVRYAVIGAGNIAQVAVLPAFLHAGENSKLVALISGDPAKRVALRERYELELDGSYEDLEAILEGGRIDAVYVATPNSLHKEYSLRAAACGVHVLCEKPLATGVSECEAIARACEANQLKLMVAYRLHFEKANLRALEIARSGMLGDVKLFSSFFSHVVRPSDIRKDESLGGGAAYDLGVYCINAARNLFGAEPTSVLAAAVEVGGTDDSTMAVLTFPGGRLAQFCVSNSVAGVSSYRIAGPLGDLRAEPAYGYTGEIALHVTTEGKTTTERYPQGDQFAPELVYFSDCILQDRAPEPSGEEAILDARVVEALHLSWRHRKHIELAPCDRVRRPVPAQQMWKPKVDRVEPVNAPGPSIR